MLDMLTGKQLKNSIYKHFTSVFYMYTRKAGGLEYILQIFYSGVNWSLEEGLQHEVNKGKRISEETEGNSESRKFLQLHPVVLREYNVEKKNRMLLFKKEQTVRKSFWILKIL